MILYFNTSYIESHDQASVFPPKFGRYSKGLLMYNQYTEYPVLKLMRSLICKKLGYKETKINGINSMQFIVKTIVMNDNIVTIKLSISHDWLCCVFII